MALCISKIMVYFNVASCKLGVDSNWLTRAVFTNGPSKLCACHTAPWDCHTGISTHREMHKIELHCSRKFSGDHLVNHDRPVDRKGIPSRSPNKNLTIKQCVPIFTTVGGRHTQFSCPVHRVGELLPFLTILCV